MKTGRTARVNLTSKRVEVYDSRDFYDWLGGRGFGVSVILKKVGTEVEPLSEGNKMVFATGCFSGTSLPGAVRTELLTKNVLNNGISCSSGGGGFAPVLKSAGFDALIVEGKAESPVYLHVHDGTIDIRDASKMWGKTTWETEDAIKEELGDADTRVLSIGPAGENHVKIACIIADKSHALAWGGSGAVMGSKNLKAIAAQAGFRSLPLADSSRFESIVDHYRWVLLSGNAPALLKMMGTHGMSGAGGWNGKVPVAVRNLHDEYWDSEKLARIREESFKKYEVERVGCPDCPIACSHLYEMRNSDEVLRGEGMHANSVRGLGTNWEVDNPFAIFKAHLLCNKLGLDVDGTSSAIAWATECFEKGKIGQDETNGFVLRWGNHEHFTKLIEDSAWRRGFGDVLAEGVYRAARAIGNGTEEFAMSVKKVGINQQSLRSHKAWALGIATSTRGGGHLGGSPQVERRGVLPPNTEWLFGNPELGNPGSYSGKGRLVAWYETYKAIVDSVGVCYFCAGWYEVCLAHLGFFVELYDALTGESITKDEMWRIGERIINYEKAFNTVSAGFTRENDFLPRRITDMPVSAGPYQGAFLELDKYNSMLDEYYNAHGWDPVTGRQKKDTLLRLGLDELVTYLGDKIIKS